MRVLAGCQEPGDTDRQVDECCGHACNWSQEANQKRGTSKSFQRSHGPAEYPGRRLDECAYALNDCAEGNCQAQKNETKAGPSFWKGGEELLQREPPRAPKAYRLRD